MMFGVDFIWEIFLRVDKGSNLAHHFLDLSRGGGFLGMRKRALIGCMSQSARGKTNKNTDPGHTF